MNSSTSSHKQFTFRRSLKPFSSLSLEFSSDLRIKEIKDFSSFLSSWLLQLCRFSICLNHVASYKLPRTKDDGKFSPLFHLVFIFRLQFLSTFSMAEYKLILSLILITQRYGSGTRDRFNSSILRNTCAYFWLYFYPSPSSFRFRLRLSFLSYQDVEKLNWMPKTMILCASIEWLENFFRCNFNP